MLRPGKSLDSIPRSILKNPLASVGPSSEHTGNDGLVLDQHLPPGAEELTHGPALSRERCIDTDKPSCWQGGPSHNLPDKHQFQGLRDNAPLSPRKSSIQPHRILAEQSNVSKSEELRSPKLQSFSNLEDLYMYAEPKSHIVRSPSLVPQATPLNSSFGEKLDSPRDFASSESANTSSLPDKHVVKSALPKALTKTDLTYCNICDEQCSTLKVRQIPDIKFKTF